MRNAATSSLLNASRPFFIRMKELPHTTDKTMRISQEEALAFMKAKIRFYCRMNYTQNPPFGNHENLMIFAAENVKQQKNKMP